MTLCLRILSFSVIAMTLKRNFFGKGKRYEGRSHNYIGNLWEFNFIPDIRDFRLMDYSERGSGRKNIKFELSDNTIAMHIS